MKALLLTVLDTMLEDASLAEVVAISMRTYDEYSAAQLTFHIPEINDVFIKHLQKPTNEPRIREVAAMLLQLFQSMKDLSVTFAPVVAEVYEHFKKEEA